MEKEKKIMITLKVKKIPPVGAHDYPALKNVTTGRIYVDTCLGIADALKFGDDGYNKFGEFVGYNIPGRWCTFHEEPECPLKKDVQFELLN